MFYGTRKSLSGAYKKIEKNYPVYVGQEFWYRLTGDRDFYDELINAFVEVADEMDSSTMIDEIIKRLSHEIEENCD